jgi:hypothetical protein
MSRAYRAFLEAAAGPDAGDASHLPTPAVPLTETFPGTREG